MQSILAGKHHSHTCSGPTNHNHQHGGQWNRSLHQPSESNCQAQGHFSTPVHTVPQAGPGLFFCHKRSDRAKNFV